MNHHLVSLLVLVAAAPTDPSPIRLPAVQQAPPQPMPADAAIVLTPDVLYVVEADVPCLTFLSPGGAVRFTKEAGPLTVRGKFVGGTGSETKKFAGKYVYLFEAVREGRDELIIVPVGATEEGAARRVTFQVGKAPQPPPDVKPDDPALTPFQQKLKDAITSDAATPNQVATYAALYRNAAKTTVFDAGLATGEALLKELQTAVKLLGLPPGSLSRTARAVADELNANITKAGILDPDSRKNIASLFTRISADLEAAK